MRHIEANLLHKLLAIFFFPFLIFIKLISPFYKIRLRILLSRRIGHFVAAAGISLCEKIEDEKTGDQKYNDIYWFKTPSCNTQLEKMVRRVFFVRWWVRYLMIADNFFPALKLVPFESRWDAARDFKGLYFKTKDIKKAYLPFSHNEEIEVRQFLNNLGIRETDKFVCLIVRDSEYLNTFFPEWDWSYHDYRDANIHTYNEAIEALANLGYWVLRMGKAVKEPLNISHPRVIDYANLNSRSDLLDIWLPANAYFSISTSTGLDAVAEAYRRPTVYVNVMNNNHFTSYHHCIWAPKNLVREPKVGNLLTLKETITNSFFNGKEYEEKGIKIIDLSSEQIKEIVLEMEMRLSGNWRVTEEEELNQRQFIKIISSSSVGLIMHSRTVESALKQIRRKLKNVKAESELRKKWGLDQRLLGIAEFTREFLYADMIEEAWEFYDQIWSEQAMFLDVDKSAFWKGLLNEGKLHEFFHPEARISQKYLEYNPSFLSETSD